MRFPYFVLLVILFLPCCIRTNQADEDSSKVYDFADSVALIRGLIKSDSLPKILEEYDQDGLNLLINNFSPAQMALESEVLNCTLPELLYFYKDQCADIELLEQLANEYTEKLKIVIIDADRFFSVAEQFEIEKFPTFVCLYQRDELYRADNETNQEENMFVVCQALIAQCQA